MADDIGTGMGDVMLMVVSFLTSLFVVLIFIVAGWYIVWVVFLSRFKLMRELLSINDEDIPKDKATTPKEAMTLAASSSPSAASSTSARRTRQHTSQRM